MPLTILKTLYQTLEDKGNPKEIHSDGPFPCNWENSWLGDGYYFWDTFIENAHWWGKEARGYEAGYIVCEATCDYTDQKCCDLVGNTNHIMLFSESYRNLKELGLTHKVPTVKRLIQFLKDDLKIFKFEAIRVNGVNSKALKSDYHLSLNFEESKNYHFLDLKPTIQICLYKKESLNLRNYCIVYPKSYTNEHYF